MAIGDVFEVVQTWRSGLASGDIDNVLHYTVIGEEVSTTDGDLALMIANALSAAWSDELQATWSQQLTFSNVAVIGLTTPTFRRDFPFNLAGRSTQGLVSIRSAPVVTKRTDVRGRRFNGRMFLPPPTEAAQQDGSLSGDAITAINAYLAQIIEITDPSVGTVDLSVYSRVQSEAQGQIVATLVTSLVPRAVLGTIRGRRRVS